MKVGTRQRYRRFLTTYLTAESARDVRTCERLFDQMRDRIVKVAQDSPDLDVEAELAALSLEYRALRDDPERYFAMGQTVASDEPPARPRADAPPTQPAGEDAATPALASKTDRSWPWALPALALACAALLTAIEARSCGWIEKRCFDSGWIPASNERNHTIKVAHGLGATPSRLQVWFSPENDGANAFPVEISYGPTNSGNPVTISANRLEIGFHIYMDVPMRGTFDAESGRWTNHKNGYLRFVAAR